MTAPLAHHEDIHALIAARAYEIWQHRGCPADDGQNDWFAARTQVMASHNGRVLQAQRLNETTHALGQPEPRVDRAAREYQRHRALYAPRGRAI
jgi:hypothetical protein